MTKIYIKTNPWIDLSCFVIIHLPNQLGYDSSFDHDLVSGPRACGSGTVRPAAGSLTGPSGRPGERRARGLLCCRTVSARAESECQFLKIDPRKRGHDAQMLKVTIFSKRSSVLT